MKNLLIILYSLYSNRHKLFYVASLMLSEQYFRLFTLVRTVLVWVWIQFEWYLGERENVVP